MIEIALGVQPTKPPSRKSAAKSSAMAGEQIDRIHDEAATPEQRARRKRRLLKGPKEFRDMCSDHRTKAKV